MMKPLSVLLLVFMANSSCQENEDERPAVSNKIDSTFKIFEENFGENILKKAMTTMFQGVTHDYSTAEIAATFLDELSPAEKISLQHGIIMSIRNLAAALERPETRDELLFLINRASTMLPSPKPGGKSSESTKPFQRDNRAPSTSRFQKSDEFNELEMSVEVEGENEYEEPRSNDVPHFDWFSPGATVFEAMETNGINFDLKDMGSIVADGLLAVLENVKKESEKLSRSKKDTHFEL